MAELSVEVKRVIDAPIERVFRAWIEPEQMKQWFSPEGMTTPEAEADGRKGGNYRVMMKQGDYEFTVNGEYLEFDEPNSLVFTWGNKTSIVAVNFKKLADDKTEVVLKHRGFPDKASRVQHDEGWVGTINKLTRHFTKKA